MTSPDGVAERYLDKELEQREETLEECRLLVERIDSGARIKRGGGNGVIHREASGPIFFPRLCLSKDR